MNNNSRKRVGYWWSEKKSQKMNLAELARQFTEKDCEFVRLDLDSDLEAQGPFDAIIHKLSDVMCKADRDPLAAQQVKSFEVSFCLFVLLALSLFFSFSVLLLPMDTANEFTQVLCTCALH